MIFYLRKTSRANITIFGIIPMNPIKPIIADTFENLVGLLHTHPDLTPLFKIENVFIF